MSTYACFYVVKINFVLGARLVCKKWKWLVKRLKFEDAAKFRDQIQAIRRVQEQQFVSEDSMEDLDVLGFAQENGIACIHILDD